MFGVGSVFSTLTQGSGSGLTSGLSGGGESSSATATSGISGSPTFQKGDLNINKTDPKLVYLVAGIAGLILLFYINKRKK
jgi:hypothetical protein